MAGDSDSINMLTYQYRARDTLSDKYDLVGLCLGLCGEAGELAEVAKKAKYQGHDLDHDKLKQEIGDVLWYLACICHVQGYKLDKVARGNLSKLQTRYPNGFETDRSVQRGA